MNTTTNLNLKLLKYNQAQKEILINEAICLLDSLIHRSAIGFAKDPPVNKNEGEVYIIPSNTTNSWGAKENSIAVYLNGWRYVEPKDGWIFWVHSQNQHYIYKNGSWHAQGNQTKHIEQSTEELILDLDHHQKYQLFLDRNTSFQIKSSYKEGDKAEFLIHSKCDIKINWPGNISWNGEKIDIMSKNSYTLVAIYRVNNLFLGKNTSFKPL